MPAGSEQSTLPFRGLTSAEVQASREKHGWNLITPPPREPWWRQLLEKFNDPIIRILMIAAVLATLVGFSHTPPDWIEGVGIVIAILLSTGLAYWNERMAEREFSLLNQVSDETPVKVIRDGGLHTLPRKELVVGDVVLLDLGEEVPADGLVLESVNLHVDESRLTGESVPVAKAPTGTETHGVEHAYPPDMVLRGTLVADGRGTLRITAVGDHTDIGKTARAAAEVNTDPTPLTRQLEMLSKLISVVGLGFAVLTFIALVTRGALNGTLTLGGPQGVVAICLFGGVAFGLAKVWLPILLDGLELIGQQRLLPAFMVQWARGKSWRGWLEALAVGCTFVGCGLLALWFLGHLDPDPNRWLAPGDGGRYLKYFMIAVTIIVVSVPEGLAMAVTLALAYSMRRMAATNNLVRQMHACETIGAATVICSDKTGTLTQNKMRLHALHAAAPLTHSLLVDALAVDSTAHLEALEDGQLAAVGNPTEGALLLALAEERIDYAAARQQFVVAKQWTFSTERKFMGTLGTPRSGGGLILHVKGAPEILLDRCSQRWEESGTRPLSKQERDEIEEKLRDYQNRGMRTLGFALHLQPNSEWAGQKLEEVAHELTWLGFGAIADPVRPEVPGAIAACRKAGVAVKMVTGDNPATATEIARQIGLWRAEDGAGQVITGPDFQALDEAGAKKAVLELKVMARARPMDKLRLVKLLKEQGQVVAVTGDGTNDAPALNNADVGLAMGRTGTAVAKEASDIILLDDSFKSIVNAILWGRSLYQNIQRFLVFQLTINVSALGIAFLGPWLGVSMPLTVMQMLWVNLIMDTFAALALATEPPDWRVMQRPPRPPSEFIITPLLARWILGTGLALLAALLTLLVYLRGSGPMDFDVAYRAGDTQTLRNLSFFFTCYVLLNFWNLFNARRVGSTRSVFDRPFENPWFWGIAALILVGQIAITQGLFGHQTFSTYPLGWGDWGLLLAGTSVILWIGEAIRAVGRWRGEQGTSEPQPPS